MAAHLLELPPELLQQIADQLDRHAQKQLALACSRTWDAATNAIWRDVKLVDKQTHRDVPLEDWNAWAHIDAIYGRDDHDDAPIIRKLLVLASNTRIAAKVRVLTHRCHLPLPAIFVELPITHFEAEQLSNDWRTLQLAYMAVRNMVQVQTLRIVGGHFHLNNVLLYGFFHGRRACRPRHLWLESCSIRSLMQLPLTHSGLETLRMRRMGLDNIMHSKMGDPFSYARGSQTANFHNGVGSEYDTSVDYIDERTPIHDEINEVSLLQETSQIAKCFNEKTYARIPEAESFLVAAKDEEASNLNINLAASMTAAFHPLLLLSSKTLRSINLDWMLHHSDEEAENDLHSRLQLLSICTFPNLRALQLRNAVTNETKLPHGIYLLYPERHERSTDEVTNHHPGTQVDLLSFMERHPNLSCLAWPMDRFFTHRAPTAADASVRRRAAAVVANLGRSLTSLRIDSYYTQRGEVQTDDDVDLVSKHIRIRRRLFISDFAAHMLKLKEIKVEGGVPRDEKRELIRATWQCPLEKIVMIGVSCPIGNTWGPNGDDLSAIDDGHPVFTGTLEAENEDAVLESTKTELDFARKAVPFRARYGWGAEPPLLQTIALYHASTITELKFCGYNGSPVLHRGTAITSSLLHHLRYFHRLKRVIMSFWLLTFFDFDWREPEIIDYWVAMREPHSKALVTVPNGTSPNPLPSMPAASATEHEDTIMTDSMHAGQTEAVPAAGADLLSTLSHLAGHSGFSNSTGLNTVEQMFSSALAAGLIGGPEENTIIPLGDANHILDASAAAQMQLDGSTSQPSTHAAALASLTATTAAIGDIQAHAQPAAPTIPPLVTPDSNAWEVALNKYFTPPALARGVYDMLSPHLSPQARRNGVEVRASFCLGVESGDIFDLDFALDRDGVKAESIVGPREECERDRWWGKLESRRWFGGN